MACRFGGQRENMVQKIFYGYSISDWLGSLWSTMVITTFTLAVRKQRLIAASSLIKRRGEKTNNWSVIFNAQPCILELNDRKYLPLATGLVVQIPSNKAWQCRAVSPRQKSSTPSPQANSVQRHTNSLTAWVSNRGKLPVRQGGQLCRCTSKQGSLQRGL